MDEHPGRRMSYWLAHVLRRERTARGLKPSEIAGRVKRDQSVISRLETGRTLPPDVDKYVAAYAELTGVEDGRTFWNQALDLWWKHGAKPVVDEDQLAGEKPTERFERTIGEAAQRSPRAPGDSAEKRTSTRKKRASG